MDLAALKAAINNVETMAAHFERILEAVTKGEKSVSFIDLDDQVHNDCAGGLTNEQAFFLRSKEYTVEWEKYLGSWTVSGW